MPKKPELKMVPGAHIMREDGKKTLCGLDITSTVTLLIRGPLDGEDVCFTCGRKAKRIEAKNELG